MRSRTAGRFSGGGNQISNAGTPFFSASFMLLAIGMRSKKAYVFATRGGVYAGTPLDTQTGYVRDFLRFIGITDVNFVYAEGLAINPQSREEGLARATAEIELLAA